MSSARLRGRPRRMLEFAVETLDDRSPTRRSFRSFCFRFAGRHVTVALTGDGGDELLLGYQHVPAHRWGRTLWCRPAADPFGLRRRAAAGQRLGRVFFLGFKLSRFGRGLGIGPRMACDLAWRGAFDVPGLSASCPRVLAAPTPIGLSGNYWRMPRASPAIPTDGADGPGRICAAISGRRAREGRPGYHALFREARSPPWTARSSATSFRCRRRIRPVPGAESACSRSSWRTRPAAVLERPKHGFGVPTAAWPRPARGAPARLHRAFLFAGAGLFEPGAVARLVDGHLSGTADARKELWALLMFHCGTGGMPVDLELCASSNRREALLAGMGIAIPPAAVDGPCFVKAQVLRGGRGKAGWSGAPIPRRRPSAPSGRSGALKGTPEAGSSWSGPSRHVREWFFPSTSTARCGDWRVNLGEGGMDVVAARSVLFVAFGPSCSRAARPADHAGMRASAGAREINPLAEALTALRPDAGRAGGRRSASRIAPDGDIALVLAGGGASLVALDALGSPAGAREFAELSGNPIRLPLRPPSPRPFAPRPPRGLGRGPVRELHRYRCHARRGPLRLRRRRPCRPGRGAPRRVERGPRRAGDVGVGRRRKVSPAGSTEPTSISTRRPASRHVLCYEPSRRFCPASSSRASRDAKRAHGA